MVKLKKIIMIGILMLILCSSTGCDWVCQGESDMTMSKDGKGTFSTTVKIYKDFFSEKYYSKVNGIDEYIAKLKAQTDKDIDLKFIIDKDKSDKVDYITVSFNYDTIEEFDEKIRIMDERAINLYNTNDANYLSSDVFDAYNNYKHTLDIELQKYLKNNGITFNSKGKNYKKILDKIYTSTKHYQKKYTGKRYFFHTKDTIDNYAKIEKKDSESILTLKSDAILAFNNYLGEINYLIGNEIIDAEKMNTVLSEHVYEKEAKYIHDFLNSVKLSKELKLIMDKDKKVKGYDIDKYSVKTFDDENFSDSYDWAVSDYFDEDCCDEEDYDEDNSNTFFNEDPKDRLETLYSILLLGLDGNMVTMVNINYGDNTYELEEYLLSYMDSITISSVKGKKAIKTWKKEVIDEYSHDKSDTDKEIDKNDNKNKNDNKDKDVNSELLDKSPDTGDDTDVSLILGLVGLAGLSGIGLIRLIRYVRN